jgi:hypothetical protein
MNFKTTYILFGVLVVLLVGLGVALWKGPTKADTSAYVLPQMREAANPLNPGQVERVEIRRTRPAEETLVFERVPGGERWKITQPRALRADDTAVNDLVRQIYDARREEKSDEPAKLADWGLEPPAEVITLTAGDRNVTLNVGDSSGKRDNDVVYVQDPARQKAMAVRYSSLDRVLGTLSDFRSRDLLATGISDIEAVALSESKKGSEPKVVELKKRSADRWQYVKPPYGDAEFEGGGGVPDPNKPPGGVNSLLTDVTNLKVDAKDAKDSDFVADDVEDLAKYHLGKGDDVLRIEIERVEQPGKDADGKQDKKTARVALLVGVGKKVDDKSDKYYACLEDERNVVKLSARSVDPFRKLLETPDALRDRNLVVFRNFQKPDALDIKNSYGVLEFRRPDEVKWKLYRGDTGQDVSDQEVTLLINTLAQKDQIKSFPDPSQKAPFGLDKPEVVVSVWVDGLAKDEKKDDTKDDKKKEDKKKDAKPKLKDPDKPAYQLRFGNRVEGQVVVERVRAGEKEGTLVRVPEGLLDMVKKGPLAYLDKTLPQFNPGPGEFAPARDVKTLVLERGGTTYEISREKEGAPWKFDKPADMKGRKADPQAVEEILRTLNQLRAQKLVAEKADPAALDKEYNLRTPPLKAVVTVTKDGKPATYGYAFGKDEDANHVYAKQGQRDVVFTVDKQALAPLQKKDLQDPTVLQFETNKVKAVKLTGWQNVVGSPLTLEVGRKDAAHWDVKKPAGFKLDEGKFGRFLAGLSNLRADPFVHKGKPAAAEDLEVAKGALVVEITVEGAAKPLVLTVGKPDGDKGYFATSSQAPDTVFLVPKGLFEDPKSRPAYFSP